MASPVRRRRLTVVAIVTGLVVIVAGVVFGIVSSSQKDAGAPVTQSDAFTRLTDDRDVTSVGALGDVTDPASLRRRLHRLLDADDPTVPISDEAAGAARACWQQTDPKSRAEHPLLVGHGTANGRPATVLAVAERGRVVTFVVDEQCQVIAAQSI
ncbi:MAG TPA: hypothetical protein VFF40_14200 [Acidimicrobiia bacterium]|nr:hypothetical protein [Acidimicrobiia bacterium]